MSDENKWRKWAVSDLDRGCCHLETARILAKNGYEHLIDELGLVRVEENQRPDFQRSYDYLISASLVPSYCGRVFERYGSRSVSLFVCRNFLLVDECEDLCRLIDQSLIPSTVTDQSADAGTRTSSTSHLHGSKSDVLTDIEARISDSLGIDLNYSEPIQGQLYSEGDEFKPHTDYFAPGTREFEEFAAEKGQRTWTFMIYLNDTAKGGGTYFPDISHEFQPVAGTALAWCNLDHQGSPNPKTLHHGKPVVSGEKYILTKWFRDRGKGSAFRGPKQGELREKAAREVGDLPRTSVAIGKSVSFPKNSGSDDPRASLASTPGVEKWEMSTGSDQLDSGLIRESRAAKMSWILSTLASLESLNPRLKIASREKLEAKEFYDEFYSMNRPLVVRNYANRLPLMDRLNWSFLESEFGEREIELLANRDEDERYERNKARHKRTARFGAFLEAIARTHESNDFYMTANNGNANRALVSQILEGITVCPEILDHRKQEKGVFLWIGPKGTRTPLHHDLTNNLMIQIAGTKIVTLISPFNYLHVYNDSHCFSEVDVFCEDAEHRWPEYAKASKIEIKLKAGDLLFLPICWWHSVESLSASITLTATNFKAQNDFFRGHPFVDGMRSPKN